MGNNRDRGQTMAGIVLAGGVTTGLVGLLAALFLLVSGAYLEAGLCLLAAAFSFGLLANAIFRD